MIDAILAGFILFRGAGPGAIDGFPYQVLPTAGGPTLSHRLPQQGELLFLRSAPGGESITGVSNFGGNRQVLVEVNLADAQSREIGFVEGSALYFPVLSPDRSMVAALIVPGRTDMPPSSFAEARLVVFPVLPPKKETGATSPFTGFRVLATSLTVAPPDWSADGRRVFYGAREKGQEQVAVVDLQTGLTRMIAPGVFPRASPDGHSLAFVQERSIVVVSSQDFEPLHHHNTEWDIGWLAWRPDGKALAIAESGPVYRSRLSVMDTRTGQVRVLSSTGVLKDMCWVARKPNWPAH